MQHVGVSSPNRGQNQTYLQKETHRFREQIYGCQGEGWGKKIVGEFGMDRYTLYLEWIAD